MLKTWISPPRSMDPLDIIIRRRAVRDLAWLLKTGTLPPIRRQRTRWFREARDRRNNVARDFRGEAPDRLA